MRKTLVSLSALLTIVFFSPFLGSEIIYADTSSEESIIKLNNIHVNKINKEIRIKTKLSLTEGILEYLLVGNQGKTYESVFKVRDNKPSELNFALLLIGCKPMNFDQFFELINDTNGSAELLKSHQESILEIELSRGGQKIDMQGLMRSRETSTQPLIWVYTEGFMTKEQGYAGDLELSYIGIWPDRIATINLFSALKNPYQGDFGYEMNKDNKGLNIEQEFEIVIRRRPS